MRQLRSRAARVGALAVAASLLLTACGGNGGGGSEGDGPRVAVVLKTLTSPYWLQVKGGAEQAGKDTGADVTLAGATQETAVQEQIDKVRAAITQQVDALVVAPTQAEQLQPVLEEAKSADIPVLLVDTNIEGWDGAETFIGTDNRSAGEQAGEFITEQTSEGSALLIRGVPGNPSTDDRIDGAKEVLEEAGIDIAAELSANSDRAEGRSVTADALQANPDISIIFAANDDMALGAIEAVKAAGLNPADMTIVGVDGTSDAVESIQNGELTASIAQNAYDMGVTSVEEALKVIDGETIEKRIDTGVTLVTADNAEEYAQQLADQEG
ncbi:sugar ABC transporter substrate-binding protein [Aeromicrobium camelliae]|uniref:Sugar ABC transporter substrate-binding protein n=1 Tax=Aeromicrobium camelliae TaxID=1538144 RepID=A0A3N6WM38_9ACTN|nr:sugar ABC transporter substrate-binding protein [Aeromicrobium camelliae]RQN08370.1 sugar ABC transporter substrate-binding protein [Aeromicrobium camelliae]